MSRSETLVFDAERAASYDGMFAPMAPLKGALHLLTRMALDGLPDDARVMSVGAGTGSELLYLAAHFPGWRFTVVEPAAPMLDICRARIAEAGIGERCTLHGGYVDSLPDGPQHHAAVSHFVSHFIVDPDARRGFFAAIAERLLPGGHLITADIAGSKADPAWPATVEIWDAGLALCGMDAEARAGYYASLGPKVALHTPEQVAGLIAAAGFEAPTHVLRMLHMHAWHARRSV